MPDLATKHNINTDSKRYLSHFLAFKQNCNNFETMECCRAEVESSKTSLASRTHFEVLGLEASSPRKLTCPRFEDSTIFWTVKILFKNARNNAENREYRFCFPQLEHRRSQKGGTRKPASPPQLKFHQWQKCAKKSYCFFSFGFFLAFFTCKSN